MRIFLAIVLIGMLTICDAQSLPIDFEEMIGTEDFIDFDGGTATVIDNPQNDSTNPSTKVAQIVREGGTIWSGSKIALAANLDFTTLNKISMKVFTSAPVGTVVKFKLEGNGTTERDVQTSVSNEWETISWDFTGEPSNFNEIVFMFDFGNVGDGSINSTFLFDDIEQVYGGKQIDWPVDFEEEDINYTMTDFGGNSSSLEVDPTNASNHVIKVIKTDEAATWAGTTIGTNAGFATDIPLSLTNALMTVKVWSPEANTPIRLKVEDSNDPTHACETETNTSLAGEWETLTFDFTNQAPGTESLEVGLSMGWTYNMASIFFNFGTEGSQAGEKIYYFDDVAFGEFSSIDLSATKKIVAFPNPAISQWTIKAEGSAINKVEILNLNGIILSQKFSNSDNIDIDCQTFPQGFYLARIYTPSGIYLIKLHKI